MKKIAVPFLISAVLIIVTFLLFDNLELLFTGLLKDASMHHQTYYYISFLVLASDIILPVPSSIVMYMNGYVLGWPGGSANSLLALMTGAVAGYYLGKFTSLGVRSKENERANIILLKYGSLAILISRGIPIISESVCIVCGYNRMPFKNYFILNFFGYIPLCFLYAFCGSIGFDENTFLISFACSIGISAVFWVAGRKYLAQTRNPQGNK